MRFAHSCLVFVSMLYSGIMLAQLPAFPGAEGFGALATGGRGGEVYVVTNLADSGRGSFRDAVSKPNRTVVFNVSGVIRHTERIQVASNITIAGETSPGVGIVIYGVGVSFSNSKNIIVRYIRFRGSINMPRGKCTLTADDAQDIIFDHCSVQWGRWDNLHIQNSNNITLQHCIIGEAIDPQRFGALLERPTNLTIHNSLWIDNTSRNPKAKAAIEYINNVVYNWGTGGGFVGGHSAADHYQDIINNYFVAGPNSNPGFFSMFSATDHVYHTGNMTDMNKDGILNGRAVSDTDFVKKEGPTFIAARQHKAPIPVTITDAATAFTRILTNAGASLQYDAVDQRLVNYAKTIGKEGAIFKTEADAGGQPDIAITYGPKDSDADGIPDAWRSKQKLKQKSTAINPKTGYSYLEEYCHSLIAERSKQNALQQ